MKKRKITYEAKFLDEELKTMAEEEKESRLAFQNYLNNYLMKDLVKRCGKSHTGGIFNGIECERHSCPFLSIPEDGSCVFVVPVKTVKLLKDRLDLNSKTIADVLSKYAKMLIVKELEETKGNKK